MKAKDRKKDTDNNNQLSFETVPRAAPKAPRATSKAFHAASKAIMWPRIPLLVGACAGLALASTPLRSVRRSEVGMCDKELGGRHLAKTTDDFGATIANNRQISKSFFLPNTKEVFTCMASAAWLMSLPSCTSSRCAPAPRPRIMSERDLSSRRASAECESTSACVDSLYTWTFRHVCRLA